MANLETLELTINGSATSASEGIDKLIASLSSLSTAIIKPYSDLVDFNKALRETASLSKRIKMPDIGKTTGSKAATSRANSKVSKEKEDLKQIIPEFRKEYAAKKPISSWRYGPQPPISMQNSKGGFQKGYESEEERKAKNPQWYQSKDDVKKGILARNESLKVQEAKEAKKATESLKETVKASREAVGAVKSVSQAAKESTGPVNNAAKSVNNYSQGVKALGGNMKRFQEAQQAARGEIKETGEDAEETKSIFQKLKEGFSSLTEGIKKFFSRIARIATTMLIRKALKGLVKAMKEGLNNVYEWSKATGGQFAKAMDSARESSQLLKNSLGAMLSPLVQSLIPLFQSLSNTIIDAANAINQFISLLSGKTSWTKAVGVASEETDDLADSAKKAGKAAKDTLAAFDELNVLTTPSGGSGSSTASEISDEFNGMFEEINTFDEKVRELANFVEEKLTSIEAVAIGVGVAIGAWKLGNAFAKDLPLLSTIFGYVATGATILITLQATWMFTDEYLDTGDEGWLFASALATAVGTTAAYAIAKKLISGKAAIYAAAITLSLSAVTDIVANLGASDVTALSQESILTTVKAAIEAGAAVGFILKATTNMGLSGILQVAGGAALMTFGVVIGIKALLDNSIEIFSLDNVISAVTTAVTTGLGLFLITKEAALSGGVALITFGAFVGLKALFNGEVELFSAESIVSAIAAAATAGLGVYLITSSLATAGGVALLTLGAFVGIKAILDTNVEMFSTESIVSAIVAGLAVGGGLFLLTGSLPVAGAAALATFGASIGIKAVINPNITWDSQEMIMSALIAALPVGLGLFVLTGSLIPAGIAAIATFGVLLALKAIVGGGTGKDGITIEWGNVNLTEEEVDKFVKTKMFTVDPVLALDLTKESISQLNIDEEGINDKLKGILGISKVIRLGIASDDDYAAIKANITGQGGLLDKVSKWINDAKTLSRRTITLMPQMFGSTEEEQNQWLASDESGWETVQEFAQNLGKQLADEIVEGENGEIEVKRPERVAKLLDEITRISEIIAGQDIATEAQINLELGLTDLDQSSFNAAMKKFNEYKTQMQTAAEEVAKQMLTNKTRLIAALKQMIEIDPDNEELKEQLANAEKGLQDLKDNWQGIIDDKFAEFYEPGRTLIQEWVEKNFDPGSISIDEDSLDYYLYINEGNLQEALKEALSDLDFDMEGIDINDFLEVGGWDVFDTKLKKQVVDYFGGFSIENIPNLKAASVPASVIFQVSGWGDLTPEIRKDLVTAIIQAYGTPEAISAIKKLIPNISAKGFVTLTNWDQLSPEIQKNYIAELKKAFGDKEAEKALKEAGINVGTQIQKGMESNTGVKKQAKKWNQDVTDEIDNKTHTTTASITYDESEAKKVSNKLGGIVTSKTPKMKSSLTYDSTVAEGTANKLSGLVTKKTPKMKAALSYDAKENAGISSKLSGLITGKTPKMKSSLTYTEKTETATRDKLAKLVTDKKPKMLSSLTYDSKASVKKRDALSGYITQKKPLMSAALTYVKKTVVEKRDALANFVTEKKPLMSAALTYVGKTAESKRDALAKIITDEKPTMTASLTYNKEYNTKITGWLASYITGKKPKMEASLTYTKTDAEAQRDDLAKVITDKKPEMTSVLTFTQKTAESKRDELAKIITDKKPLMTSALTFVSKTAGATRDKLAKIITDKKPEMTSSIAYNEEDAKEKAEALSTIVSDIKPTVTANVGVEYGDTSGNDVGSLWWLYYTIAGINPPTVKTKAGIDQTSGKAGSLPWLAGLFTGLNPTVNANATFDKSQTKKALTAAVTGITVGLVIAGIATTLGSLTFKASGGFVDSGDLFVANENGVPEMVGSFGHQTAVANNDQIVAGIAGGVAAANAEQNALLREQNGLLRGILQKTGNVQFGASSALGRVVSQSLDMYSAVTG